MKRLRLRAEGGFTLIELLVVIAIIGILAAIAIPQFAAYRKRSFEAQVQSDLRNAATAMEAYFVTSNTYRAGALSSGVPEGYNQSKQITMASSGGAASFTLTATHQNCTGGTNWTYSSQTGSIAAVSCP